MKKLLTFLLVAATLFVASNAAAQEKGFNAAVFDPIQIVKKDQGIKGVRLNLFYGNNASLKGADLAFFGVNRIKGDMTGAQLGIANWTESGEQIGGQLGLVSWTGGYITGAQLGWAFNYAKEVTGAQIGVVNYAEKLNKGLQIGLVNIAKNGFLPVFVIFNFNFS